MKKQIAIILTGLSLVGLVSCGSEPILASRSFDLGGENKDINSNTLQKDTTSLNNYFSRIDSIIQYGYGWAGELSQDYKNKKVKVIISGAFRSSESYDGGIVFAVNNINGESKFWINIAAKKFLTATNTWVSFKDSVYLEPAVTNMSPIMISTYPYKPSGKGFLDVDDLKIEIKETE